MLPKFKLTFVFQHVELLINATHFHIGGMLIIPLGVMMGTQFNSESPFAEMNVRLRSPAGTISVLAVTHPDPHSEYKNWVFTSMRHWGEQAVGKWTVTVFDETSGGAGKPIPSSLSLNRN